MSVGRPLLETGEEKEDRPVVSSPSFFQVPPLTEICMDTILSKEHEKGYRADKQSLGRLYDSYKQFKQKKLKSLLEAILWGDPKTTLELIDQYPALLLEKLEGQLELNGVEVEGEVAEAPSGHKTTNTTAYRLALAVEDTELVVEIRARLIALAGKEAAEAQWQEQFPEGWEATERKELAPICEQLEELAQAIRDAASGDIVSSGEPKYQLTVREGSKVAEKLDIFKTSLELKVNEIIMTTGREFIPELLFVAFKIYKNDFRNPLFRDHSRNYFGNDQNDPRALLFWQRVIGSIQRFLPANYVQAFCGGLNNTTEKPRRGLLRGRSLTFKIGDSAGNWIPTAFYPLSESHVGVNFAIGHWNGIAAGCGGNERIAHQREHFFRSLYNFKWAVIQSLKPLTDPRRDLGVP